MRFSVKFNQIDKKIPVVFNSTKQVFTADFKGFQTVTVLPETYDGSYDVTPLITSQVLPTNKKYMIDDVRIDMIPTREVLNASGGVTFIVG